MKRGTRKALSKWDAAYLFDEDAPGFAGFLVRRARRGLTDTAELWAANRDDVLREWIRDYPGTRPYAWWQHDAPEPRRRIGGSGLVRNERHAYGLPTDADWRVVDPNNPPSFESQAAYLDRHGLLSDAEHRRLTPADFEPVTVRLDAFDTNNPEDVAAA
jgi:hypothetical protein